MSPYQSTSQPEPTRDELDRMTGPIVVEFGASWCPHCQAIQNDLRSLLDEHCEVQHLKVEDGRGKPLGRSFRVKLWPTLIFMRDGQVLDQLVRPDEEQMAAAFEKLDSRSSEN